MVDYEKELASALADLEVAAEKPCGCEENKRALNDNPFAPEGKLGDSLSAELASALKALGASDRVATEFPSDMSPAAKRAFLEFSEIDMGMPLGLEEIVSIAERYPGLKITFSF